MRRSTRLYRLNQREEKTTVKKIAYSFFFSILLLGFIFTLGIPLLGKFADFLDVIFRKTNSSQVSTNQSAQAPILDPLPEATNSARLTISGFSATTGKILIYNNGEKVGETSTDSGKFQFTDFTLKSGTNIIAAKSVLANGKESDFSTSTKVTFLQKEPSLTVDNPSDGQAIGGNNRLKVSGKTDPNVQVYANGFLANTSSDGSYDVFIPLSSGDNNIEIKAIDLAGNTKIIKRKVTFNP